MTPSGSFHGSKRETWHIMGRSMSIPNWSHTYAASSGDSAMFLGASGSMAGGMMRAPLFMASGTYSWTWKTDAGYWLMYGSMRASVAGLGVERSMWQRHTHAPAFSRTSECMAAGWGS